MEEADFRLWNYEDEQHSVGNTVIDIVKVLYGYFCGEHSVTQRRPESLFCTPETDVTLCVGCTQKEILKPFLGQAGSPKTQKQCAQGTLNFRYSEVNETLEKRLRVEESLVIVGTEF